MKTAKEWSKVVTPARSDLRYVDQIKQIQLGYYKQGMIDAAEICNSTIDENGEAGASECDKRIRTTANNLTKLPE